jgi:DNA polymerase I-like protein with 3'-5' exonuclease and polymerase domains
VNLQQVPSRTEIGGRMRECFVPNEGNKIVGGDYSGKLNKLMIIFVV